MPDHELDPPRWEQAPAPTGALDHAAQVVGAAPRTCPHLHPVSAVAKFCDTCGAPVTSPAMPVEPLSIGPAREPGPFTSKHIVLGAVGLAVLFVVLITGLVVHLRQSDGATRTAALPAILAPTTTTVLGTLSLTDSDTASNSCVGEGGYADIRPGATVILTDETGKILGSSSLGEGSDQYSSTTCVYSFTITDVPKDAAQYAVEVTHRGKVVNSRAELEASSWNFSLSLG